MADLSGVWKLDRNENFEEYLKALGMNVVKRKVALATTPVMDIKQVGTHFYIKTTTIATTQVMDFNVGEPFKTELSGITSDKWEVKSTWDGKKLTTVASPGGSDGDLKSTTISRELAGDELMQTFEAGNVVAKRYYKKK